MSNLVSGESFPDTGLAALPDIDVEISLTPPTQGPLWRSVVGDARMAQGLATRRGRSRELDRFQTGTLDIELNNRDRTYDPEYTAGSLYDYIKPQTRIRVLARWNSVTYVVFDGFIDGFEQQYGALDSDATALISAGDGFKALAAARVSDGAAWDVEVRADSPLVWHKLGDFVSSGTMADSANGYSGRYSLGGTSIAGLVAATDDSAVDFDGTDDYAKCAASLDLAPVTRTTTAGDGHTLEFWFQTTQVPTVNRYALLATIQPFGKGGTGASGYAVTDVTMDSSGVIVVANDASDSAVNDGEIHHLVYVVSRPAVPGATFKTLYIDGVEQSGSVGGFSDSQALQGFYIGFAPGIAVQPMDPFNGIIDDVVLYDYALTAARIQAHYDAGKSGASGSWGGDYTGTRARRMLDIAGWPGFEASTSADRDIDTGSSACGPASLSASSILDYLQTLADTEQGQMYMGLDGAMSSDDHFKFVFRQRHALITATRSNTSQATFGDSGAELKYADVLIEYGENRLHNVASVTRLGGAEQTASDAESQREYFKRSYSKSGLLYASDNDSFDHATWAVDRYKDPEYRIVGLVIKPQRSPSDLWPHALGREIGDRITVKRRPQGVGDAISKEAIIEGVEHSMADGEWTTIWRLSEAETKEYWILGTSELGVNTRLAF